MEYGVIKMLEFKDVTFGYSGESNNIMEHLSFAVNQGEFVSFIGASGCGKSTIFRLINKLELPNTGEILLNGNSIVSLENYGAYMPQKDLLLPWRNIAQNVALPMEIQKKSKLEIKLAVEKILEEVGLLDYKNHSPSELSGGMRQRVSFARTLLTGNNLLLLDEPFSALDSLTRIDLQEWLLNEWEKRKQTVMFVTHDVEEALFLSHKVFIMRDKPVKSLEMYEVPLPHPRSREDMKRPEVVALKEALICKLRREVPYDEK